MHPRPFMGRLQTKQSIAEDDTTPKRQGPVRGPLGI